MTRSVTPIVSRSKNKWYKAQKVQKYVKFTTSKFTNDDEVSSFLLAVTLAFLKQSEIKQKYRTHYYAVKKVWQKTATAGQLHAQKCNFF